MNYKQSILNNFSNIRKQNRCMSVLENNKEVSKYYKVIDFSLAGKGKNLTAQDQKKTSYIRPLRITVLKFHTPERSEKSYSIDVSCFFNKPSKSVILKYLKKIKISKQFAHWIKPNGILKKEYTKGGFNNINKIVGSDISMYEYELYIDLKFQNIPLSKSHISYIVAQTLCKTQYINKSHQLSYTEDTGVIGAFILKNRHFRNYANHPIIGYFISDNELKQCALANFTKKQTVKVTEWASAIKLRNRETTRFEHLLGDISTSGEQVRGSIDSKLSSLLAGNLQAIGSISTLSCLKRPLYTLVSLLAKTQHLCNIPE